jgi:hypothetical protein
MSNDKATRIELTPSHTDLEIAGLVYRALAAVRNPGRFGDRKVFISALWEKVLRLDAEAGGHLTHDCTLEDFKARLLRSRRLTRDGTEKGAPLVVLVRADFVAAINNSSSCSSMSFCNGAALLGLETAILAHSGATPPPFGPPPFGSRNHSKSIAHLQRHLLMNDIVDNDRSLLLSRSRHFAIAAHRHFQVQGSCESPRATAPVSGVDRATTGWCAGWSPDGSFPPSGRGRAEHVCHGAAQCLEHKPSRGNGPAFCATHAGRLRASTRARSPRSCSRCSAIATRARTIARSPTPSHSARCRYITASSGSSVPLTRDSSSSAGSRSRREALPATVAGRRRRRGQLYPQPAPRRGATARHRCCTRR